MTSAGTNRFALIGFGAITSHMVSSLIARNELGRLCGVLDRPGRARIVHVDGKPIPIVDRIDDLLRMQPDIVGECAGHGAVSDYGEAVLRNGIDLVVASVGALADERVMHSLKAAAGSGGGRLLVPSGAVGGIDGLLAARNAGLTSATYTSAKPPVAWKGTPAERVLDLDAQTSANTFFVGSAREAAIQYPKNVNIGATVAFAGLGLDRTRVQLVADPALTAPLGIIEAEGEFGRFRFETLAFASPANPKTSVLTAYSMQLAIDAGWAFDPFAPGASG
jgi:aspartate dehydrogenase